MFSRCLYPKSNFSYLEPNVEWNRDINNDGYIFFFYLTHVRHFG